MQASNYPGLILSLGLSACASHSVAPSHLAKPLVSYSKPAPESLDKIRIQRVALTEEQFRELAILPKIASEFGSRWLVQRRPDTMRPGPWTTQLLIFNAADTRHCLRLDLIDHASYDVQCTWLNEKMLFVKVWWGRIVATDFVLDTETCKFAYAEDANYFRMLYSREEMHEPAAGSNR